MSIKALQRHLKPLMPYLETQGITEICLNRPGELYIEKQSKFTRHDAEELDLGFIESLAQLIAENNRKDFPHPLLSGSLPNGERAQFVMNPACEEDNILFSIRRHEMKNMTLDDYVKAKAFEEISSLKKLGNQVDISLGKLYEQGNTLEFLKLAVQSKKNIIICGGTGTGKTTFLNACLRLIPNTERLITVEDVREVNVTQPNAVHLLFNEDDERITALKVFKVCLRLRPDRIFLSELRGEEAWPFLRAANSGHPGSLSTVHADTPEACFDQLVFMMQQAGSTSSDERIRNYIKSIVNVVIQLKRCPTPDRFMYVSDIYFDAIHK